MMKKMVVWIGAAMMAGALAVACGGAAKKAETTPEPAAPAGGAAYGSPEAPANPCAPAVETAPQ